MPIRLVPTGELISEYLNENSVSQKELSKKSGYTEKQISQILNSKLGVSKRFAEALESSLPGTKAKFWLDYDAKYLKQVEVENKELKDVNYDKLSKTYGFDKIFNKSKASRYQRYNMWKKALNFSNVNESSFLENVNICNSASFLQDNIKIASENKNMVFSFLILISYYYSLKPDEKAINDYCGGERLYELLLDHKSLFKVNNTSDLCANIETFCSLAGINVIFSHSAPSTYVRGAVFNNNHKIYLLLTDRYKSVEYTLFAFIHECFHLINNDVTLDNNNVYLEKNNIVHEDEISKKAKRFFVDDNDYEELKERYEPRKKDLSCLFSCAERNETTPGMLVTFLQHDKVINYGYLRNCLHKIDDKERKYFIDVSNEQ